MRVTEAAGVDAVCGSQYRCEYVSWGCFNSFLSLLNLLRETIAKQKYAYTVPTAVYMSCCIVLCLKDSGYQTIKGDISSLNE